MASDAVTDSDLEVEIALFHQPAIDSARKMILYAGFWYPLVPIMMFGMLAMLVGPSIFASWAFAVLFGIGLAALGVHVALWWWATRSPLAATVTALSLFLVYQVSSWMLDARPNLLISIIGLFVLGRGVMASYRVHRLRKRAGYG